MWVCEVICSASLQTYTSTLSHIHTSLAASAVQEFNGFVIRITRWLRCGYQQQAEDTISEWFYMQKHVFKFMS